MAEKVEIVEETTETSEHQEVVVEEEVTEVAVAPNKSTMITNPFESKDSFKDAYVLAQNLAKSDMIPDSYRNKPMNVMIALEQAQRMHVSPLMVMQQLYVVKGKPSWSGQACAMLVQGCGLFENVKLNYVGEKGKESYGAFVSATRKSDGAEVVGTTVDMNMAKGEGWTSNNKWKTMTDQMLGYRAYTFFARLHCPAALNGFSTEGEIEDIEASKRAKAKADYQEPF